MDQTATLMTIKIREGKTGVFFATSEDEPTFFVSAVNAADLYSAIPLALEDMFRARHLDVAAIPTSKGDFAHRPWAIVPRELLAQVSERRTTSVVACSAE